MLVFGAGTILRRARVRVVGRVGCVGRVLGAPMWARLSSAESSSWTGEVVIVCDWGFSEEFGGGGRRDRDDAKRLLRRVGSLSVGCVSWWVCIREVGRRGASLNGSCERVGGILVYLSARKNMIDSLSCVRGL